LTTRHYRVVTTPLFEKQFKKLDSSVQRLVAKYIKSYLNETDNPRSNGKPLVGNMQGKWRYRIADYRLICEIQDNQLIIVAIAIGHRREIYR